jgi:hypothetical protein
MLDGDNKWSSNMNIVLHLGLPKTGSTFLQTDIFMHLQNVNILFKFRYIQEAYDDWLYDTILDINKPIDFQEVKKRRSEYLVDNMPNLVSEEIFYCGEFGMFRKEDDRFVLLDRIYKIFPEARVILAIRNKKTLLVSWYKQYVQAGGVLSFDDFIRDVMNLEKLNYEQYIERLVELYGKKNVFIFTFENLSEKPEQTIKEICNFIGCEVPSYKLRRRNISYGKTELKASLILNRLFKNRVHNRGVPWPVTYILLPHRILFQSRFFRGIPRTEIELEDLIQSKGLKEKIESFFAKGQEIYQ